MEEQLGWRQSLADPGRLARVAERSQTAPIGDWGRRDPGNGRLRLRHARYGKKAISDSDQSGFPPCPQCTMLGQSERRKWLIRLRQIVVIEKGLLGSLGSRRTRRHGRERNAGYAGHEAVEALTGFVLQDKALGQETVAKGVGGGGFFPLRG